MSDDFEQICIGAHSIKIRNSILQIEQYLKIMKGSYSTCASIGGEIIYIKGLVREMIEMIERQKSLGRISPIYDDYEGTW